MHAPKQPPVSAASSARHTYWCSAPQDPCKQHLIRTRRPLSRHPGASCSAPTTLPALPAHLLIRLVHVVVVRVRWIRQLRRHPHHPGTATRQDLDDAFSRPPLGPPELNSEGAGRGGAVPSPP
eukprot:9503477-Pyramimonas_sp.AAC.1